MARTQSISSALRSTWNDAQRIERIGYVVGALLLAGGLVHLAVLVIGNGSWQGPVSLRKPATFGLSFGLTLITVVWVASFLHLDDRVRRWLISAFTAACALETALVTMQAWRGVPSHFNLETTFDAIVARVLAGGGMVLVAIIIVLAFSSVRANPAVPMSLRIAIRIGFLSLVGAVLVGALMIAKGMILVFAGDPEGAYATGGTLKPTHGVTMHGILVLPLVAWLLSFADLTEPRRIAAVLVAASGYVVLVSVVVVANVTGIELEDMSRPLIPLLAAGVVLLVGPGVLALFSLPR